MKNKKLFEHSDPMDLNLWRSELGLNKAIEIGSHPHVCFMEYSHDYLDREGNVVCRVFKCTCGKEEYRTFKD